VNYLVSYSSSEKLAEIRSRRLYRGPDWEKIRARILARDKKCVKCGVPAQIVHHISPWSWNMDNSSINLASLCNRCHSSEHNYMKRLKKPSPAMRKHIRMLLGETPCCSG
jgi:5-methylcytosine-specific restriction endonuclease McrA